MLCYYTTFANLKDAKRICKILLQNKCIACANIIEGVHSLYVFKNKFCDEKECIVFLKTLATKEKKLLKMLKKHHPYQVPTFARISMTQKNSAYLNWLKKSLS